MEQKKEFWIAFLINFFLTGGGHIYARATGLGAGLLAANIISWALTPAIPFFMIVVIITWVYALATSKEVVEAYNKKIDAKKVAKEANKTANSITPEQFISSINKANELFAAEIITEVEFQAKKQTAISDLQFKNLNGDEDDVLLGLVSLKKNGAVTAEELQQIKKIISYE